MKTLHADLTFEDKVAKPDALIALLLENRDALRETGLTCEAVEQGLRITYQGLVVKRDTNHAAHAFVELS